MTKAIGMSEPKLWALGRDARSDRLLRLAGELATAARAVVGGRSDLTIVDVAPANVCNLSATCGRLREALDRYDAAIAGGGDD